MCQEASKNPFSLFQSMNKASHRKTSISERQDPGTNSSGASGTRRIIFLDQTKAIMIALVIATHTILVGTLFTTDLKQIIEAAPSYEAISFWFGWICNTFYMNILFLISGYLLPSSVHKRGVTHFAKHRLLRLGVPLMIAIFILNNITPIAGLIIPSSTVYGKDLNELPLNRIGPQWFLLVLIIFNSIYCLWVSIRKNKFSVDNTKPLPSARAWLISAIVLGMLELIMSYFSGFWVDLKDSNFDGLGYQGIHLWTYGFLFFLGCKAASHQWLERIDKRLAIQWLQLSVGLTVCLLAANHARLMFSLSRDYFQLITPIMTFLTPLIGWGFIAAILTWNQEHEHSNSDWLVRAGKDSFGAYLVHIPLLAGAMVGFYTIGIRNIWIIAVGATAIAIVLSFSASHQLRRIPFIKTII